MRLFFIYNFECFYRSMLLPKLSKLSFVYSILLFLSYSSNSYADELSTISDTALSQPSSTQIFFDDSTLKALAQHRQWQHLLFYKNGRAEVISPNFYLSDPQSKQRKNFSPYQELKATLAAANDSATVCRYPARFFWLNHQLPALKADLSHCKKLPNPKQKISLILVSNYLKNPASTFGHVLVSTGNDSIATQHATTQIKYLSGEDLLNQSYNFGATIPPNENSILYALKGLFGFYQAGFSHGEYFKQDTVYSKKEQRDMWEYVLHLNEFDRALLNYHLYEAQSARFQYYFIKQNCGYRSGELLELVRDINMTNRPGGWYAPDFVFDQLTEYPSSDKRASFIERVYYIPSEQTQLRQKFSHLSKELQNTINQFIVTEDFSSIEKLSQRQQALVLDFLITHRNYMLSQNDSEHHQDIKKLLVRRRLLLPIYDDFNQLPLNNKPSPAMGSKTTLTTVGINQHHQAKLALSMFIKDPLNTYQDIDRRFEMMKFAGLYDNKTYQLTLDEFVFLDMQQIEHILQPLAGEPKMSWQLKTGIRQDSFLTGRQTYVQAGIGAGLQLSAQQLWYGLVNVRLHDRAKHLDGQLEVGLRHKWQHQALEVHYQLDKRLDNQTTQWAALVFRQDISKNNQLRFIAARQLQSSSARQTPQTDLTLAFHHYW